MADFRVGRYAEALDSWQAAAAAGDARGALYTGVLYDTGLGVTQDEATALQWYYRAADLGSAAAMFNIAVLYDSGSGVAKDPAQAAVWYWRAADAGFARAEYNLAMLYEAGIGVPRDRAQEIALYRRAAQHGIAAALAHLQARHQPTPAIQHAAIDPAMQDFERAQRILLARGPGEASQAAGLLRSSADKGNPLAQYDLGYCYEHGIGVAQDPAQAYAWYQRAASHSSGQPVHDYALAGLRSAQQGLTQAQQR